MNLRFATAILLMGPSLAACSPASAPGDTQAEAAPQVLEGVWRRTRIDVDAGPDAGAHSVDVQPAIYIFSKTHYAIAAVEGFAARAYLGEAPSDANMGLALTPYSASMGGYASDPYKLTLSPLVAKDPADMVAGKTMAYDISWVDDGAWLIERSPDGSSVSTKLERLEKESANVTPEAQRLRGVWRRVEMVVGGGENSGTHLDDMQPGFYIFDPPYFAGTFVSSFAPRPLLSARPTDEERGKVFTPFASFAGTYSLSEGELVFRPLVTSNPNNMRGRPFQPITTEWAGEDVWFIYEGANGIQNRVRLTRVQD